MSEQMKRILESKRDHRSKLAALRFEEKIVFLERLRLRSMFLKSVREATLLDQKTQ